MHELEVLLSRLKMEHLSYHVESLLEQAAKKELNYREFLCMALQQEWNGRHQRGMESRLKQARLPWVKTLEQFDFTFQPGIDRKVVRELAGLAFVERSENVILLGPPGVGKTHLAIALGVKAVDAGHRVLFMPLDRLIATLMKAKQENSSLMELQRMYRLLDLLTIKTKQHLYLVKMLPFKMLRAISGEQHLLIEEQELPSYTEVLRTMNVQVQVEQYYSMVQVQPQYTKEIIQIIRQQEKRLELRRLPMVVS